MGKKKKRKEKGKEWRMRQGKKAEGKIKQRSKERWERKKKEKGKEWRMRQWKKTEGKN